MRMIGNCFPLLQKNVNDFVRTQNADKRLARKTNAKYAGVPTADP